MRYIIPILCFASACLAACASDEQEQCSHDTFKYYDEALSLQLTKNGIPNTLKAEKGVCFGANDAPKMEVARRQVDNYFHEVATLLKDSCEENAFVQWATREKLRFEVRETKTSDGKPGGRMFMLRSFSADDVAVNQQRLWNDAPKQSACQKEKSK